MDSVRLSTALPAPAPWGMPVVLGGGTRALMRPVMPRDKAKLHHGMKMLSSLARRHRFFSPLEDLDDDLMAYLTELDYRSHFAWVVVALEMVGQPIIAVGRYIRLAEDPAAAEMAFVVGDDFQHQGLATMLLDLLAVVARANGIERFYARLMADNTPMRNMLTKAGAKLELEDAGVLQTTMGVPPSTGRFNRAIVLSVATAAAAKAPAA